jgi:hypothetical protein
MYQSCLDFFKPPVIPPVIPPLTPENNLMLDLLNCFRYAKILSVMALVLGVLILTNMGCSQLTYPTCMPHYISNTTSFLLESIKSIESLSIERLRNVNAVNIRSDIIEHLLQLKNILKEFLQDVLFGKKSAVDPTNYQLLAERYAAHLQSLRQYQDNLR